jgi:MoaA/NifB/PqqE/SkfB family radical SAM enzyme/SAM-dependent methyltransferase
VAISAESVLHVPALTRWKTDDGVHLALDPEAPNWVATDDKGAQLLALLDGRRTLGEIAARARLYPDLARGLQHTMSFAQALLRAGLAKETPFVRARYAGRADRLPEGALRELWLHTNDSCNLTCGHCLVSSGPTGSRGLPTELLLRAIDEAAALGVERYYFTGGEPSLRADLRVLVERVTAHHGRELVVLTNATLLDKDRHRELLASLDRDKVRFQVSLDGTRAEENDPIRGAGSFEKASAGLSLLASLGFSTSLTIVPHASNLARLVELPALARRLGAASLHLMWPHRRGRALSMLDDLPKPDRLLPVVRAVRDAADAIGVRLDNVESLRQRVNAIPGVKHDLGMAGVEALCLHADGLLYPSAATAGEAALAIGKYGDEPLETTWRSSRVAQALRRASIADSPARLADPLRFVTGGGDLEHAYYWSGSLLGEDPYAPIYDALARDLMADLGREGRARADRRAGGDAPIVFHAMGEGALACGDELPGAVRTLHSNCVLAFDVDRPRTLMRAYYGAAAVEPKADLCCPVRPSEDDLRHIPKDVVDRFYGCGSPVQDAALQPGEAHLDLGSGAGIDVFVAAKYVGPSGRAIGVDMTDAMLAVARENQPVVARNLGYDVVAFHKGLLESIPLGDHEVDCVTSNCVVNLSPDKRAVFAEIARVLRDHGRLVLADIVAERSVPPHLRVNPQLWGECLSGALTEDELLAELERAGFHGVEVLKRTFWREVQGHAFWSVTLRAYAQAPVEVPRFVGHTAIYLGPYKAVADEDGNQFRRDEPVPVSTQTAARLLRAPYAGSFRIVAPSGASTQPEAAPRAEPTSGCCS